MFHRYTQPTQEHQTTAMEQLEQFNAEQQIAAFERQSAMKRRGREKCAKTQKVRKVTL
jgi:hypothetical protein